LYRRKDHGTSKLWKFFCAIFPTATKAAEGGVIKILKLGYLYSHGYCMKRSIVDNALLNDGALFHFAKTKFLWYVQTSLCVTCRQAQVPNAAARLTGYLVFRSAGRGAYQSAGGCRCAGACRSAAGRCGTAGRFRTAGRNCRRYGGQIHRRGTYGYFRQAAGDGGGTGWRRGWSFAAAGRCKKQDHKSGIQHQDYLFQ
jgi:hypothetical protein